jgi:hypothetical protein
VLSRLAGRLVTGPLAFFVGGVIEWVAALRELWRRRRRG